VAAVAFQVELAFEGVVDGLDEAAGGEHHGRRLEQHEIAGAPDVADACR
jgi:hypothetical protein